MIEPPQEYCPKCQLPVVSIDDEGGYCAACDKPPEFAGSGYLVMMSQEVCEEHLALLRRELEFHRRTLTIGVEMLQKISMSDTAKAVEEIRVDRIKDLEVGVDRLMKLIGN